MSEVTVPRIDWRVALNRATPAGIKGWGRVRAAQLVELRRALTVAAWGQAINALLLVYALHDDVPVRDLTAWVAALVLLMVVALIHNRWSSPDSTDSVSQEIIERAGYYSIVFGTVWAVPMVFFFPLVDPEQQLAIGIIAASMMAGAAFVFSPIPPAAGGYVCLMGGAVTLMLNRTGSPVITAIGPVYTAGLLAMLLSNGRAFMQRRCTEIALEERTDTVSLLLREFESSDADWLWETNEQLCFQTPSARFARAIGREPEQLDGLSILELVDDRSFSVEGRTNTRLLVDQLSRQAAFNDLTVPVLAGDGVKWIELSARPSVDQTGHFLGYRGVGSDVTETEQSARRIAHMARHDALTGLPNRLHLLESLGDALEDARRHGRRCAVLLIDLDRFKSVNDTLGHVAGDHLLQQVSSRFAPILAPDMTAGRLGGDEFAIVVPNLDRTSSVEMLCFDIIEALKQPFIYYDQHLFVGASIGVAIGPADGNSVEELIRNADLALYRAKQDGGNDVCLYEPGLHAKAEERRKIELALRGALDAGEFSLVYQPVVDIDNARIKSFEALLRWHSRDLGEVSPAKFIPLAEETGLVGRIGEWVLREACSEAVRWPQDVTIAVNVSPLQLNDPGFMLTLISALSTSGLDPNRLELEITETVFLQITPLTQKVLHQIQSLGVRLAIDDFGTGYSSLSYLRDSNFDTIKIDRSFVQAVRADDPGSGAIIRAVIALAENLGMATVAEGVEDAEQLRLIRALGCRRIQGYHISRPAPATTVRRMISEGTWKIAA